MMPLGVVGSARAASGSAWVTSGLEVHLDGPQYPGSGATWQDLSGHGRHATLLGATSYSAGMLVLAGGGSAVSIPYQLPSDFTVEMAMRFDVTLTGWATLWGAETWGAAVGWLAYAEGGSVLFRRSLDNGNGPQVPPPMEMHLLAFVKSGTAAYIYRDGSRYSTGPMEHATANTSLLLGARHMNDGAGVNDSQACRFGEARIYSRALDAAEVLANFEVSRGRYGL